MIAIAIFVVVVGGALIATRAFAQADEVLAHEDVNLSVGATARTTAPEAVIVEGATFAQAKQRFDDGVAFRNDPADQVLLPMTEVLGNTEFGVADADIRYGADNSGKFTITVRGVLAPGSTLSIYRPGDDVFIYLRWGQATDPKPEMVVMFKSKGQLLGDAFGGSTARFPGNVVIPELSATVGKIVDPMVRPTTDTKHISRPGELPTSAVEFFEEIYGVGGLPLNNVGPLEDLTAAPQNLFLTASVAASEFGETAEEMFSFGAAGTTVNDDTSIVLEGSLGVKVNEPFDPGVANWAVQLILPQVNLPASTPEFLGDVTAGGAFKLARDPAVGGATFTFTADLTTEITDDAVQTWEIEFFFGSAVTSVVPKAPVPACPAPEITAADTDGDKVSDTAEMAAGTDETDEDTDDDGRCDGQEAADGTDPLDPDTDDDGVDDGAEAGAGTNPLVQDTDGDGLTDDEEGGFALANVQTRPRGIFVTDPLDFDSDDNGIADGLEDEDGDTILNQDENEVKNRDIAVGFRVQVGGNFSSPEAPWFTMRDMKVQGEYNRSLNPQGVVETTYKGELKALATVAGADFEVRLKGESMKGSTKKYEARLVVTGSLVITDLLSAVGIPLPDASILAVSLDSPFLVLNVDGAKKEVYATGTFAVTIEGKSYGVFALLGVDNSGGGIAGIRPEGDILLSDILPGAVGDAVKDAADFQLAAADGSAGFGLVYAKTDLDKDSITLQPGVRDFFKPLLGKPDNSVEVFNLKLPAGISLLASLPLPEGIAETVSKLGVGSRATMAGTIPFGTGATTASFSLATRVQSDLLPEIVQSIELKIGVSASSTEMAFSLEGTVRLRFRAGMDPTAAATLDSLGIPVTADEAVPMGTTCANGTTAQPSDLADPSPTEYFCFDVLDAIIKGSIATKATPPSTKLSFEARIETPVGGSVWNPFGLEWIGVDSAAFVIEVTTDPAGTALTLGLQFDLEIGGKDFLVAGQMGARVTQVFPFLVPEFKGFRVASGAGVEIADFFAIANKVAEVDALKNNLPVPPALNPSSFGIPNVALRNLEFSLSPEGASAVCIAQGLVIRADVYLNPTGSAPVNNPECDGATGLPVIADADKCQNNRANGCVFQAALVISKNGFQANFDLAKIEAGPVTLGPLTVDIAITPSDQHFLLVGEGKIETNGQNPTTIVEGELKVSLSPSEVDIFGRIEFLDAVQALVDLKADVGIFRGQSPNLELHILLASTSTDELTGNTFGSTVSGEADPVLQVVRTTAVVAGGVIDELETSGSLVKALKGLPADLRAAGIAVPGWLTDFNNGAADVLEPVEDIASGLFDLALNGGTVSIPGIPGLDIPAVGCAGVRKNGKCWTTPPFDIEVSGICDSVFPAGSYPGLRNSAGDCTRPRFFSAVVTPFFEKLINEIAGTSNFKLDVFLDRIATLPAGTQILDFECAELNLVLNANTQKFDTAINMRIFGRDVQFKIEFDFARPVTSALNLVPTFIDRLISGGNNTPCQGLNTEVFALGANAPPSTKFEAGISLNATTVNEGMPLTATIPVKNVPQGGAQLQVDFGVPNGIRTVNVNPGDTSKTVNFTYADDLRLGTPSDQYFIDVRWVNNPKEANSLLVRTQVVVNNVAPDIVESSVQVSGGGTFLEGDQTTLDFSFTDPGTEASYFYTVDWGDGTITTDETSTKNVSVTHTYADDNPTATPSDPVDIIISVSDDDTGRDKVTESRVVANQDPTDLVVERVDADGNPLSGPSLEGELVFFEFTYTDPGTGDTHVLDIDWGDGNVISGLEYDPSTAERLIAPQIYADDNPTGTPLDTLIVTFTVVDDDTGSVTQTFAIEVANVAPVVATPIVTPSGPTDEGAEVVASTTFTDVGIEDTHTCTVDYGDGSGPQTGTIDATAGTCTGPSHWYPDNAVYTVTIEVTDDDTGTTARTTTHEVLNVDPVIVALSNTALVCGATPDGDSVNILVNFIDPGFDNPLYPSDETFTATIDWGDGTVTAATINEVDGAPTILTRGTASGTHTYANGGIFPVTVTLLDDDGGTDVAETVALVTGAGVLNGQVQAVGTFGDDDIKVQKQGKSDIRVDANFLPSRLTFSSFGISSVRVLSCAGDDSIKGHSTSSIIGIFEGEGGDDRIFGSNGADTLLGGEGDDFLQAGTGNDTIDGGPGVDQGVGGSGFDTCINVEQSSGCEA